MAARPGWSGFLKFNLISVPVQAYNASAPGGGKVGFHMLHAKCHQRIQYKKFCPIHGEVSNDEIVFGHEESKGHYVEISPDERKKVRSERDETIDVESFVRPEAIDPVIFSGQTYFLVPDGQVAQKPYVVMLDALHEQNRFGIAHVVFSGRLRIAAIHAYKSLLAMTLLNYESEMKKPSTFAKDVAKVDVSSEERKLAKALIETTTTDKFDWSEYKDEYTIKLTKLVESKTGRKVKPATAPRLHEPEVINLMDALRKSLTKAKQSRVSPEKAVVRSRKKSGPHAKRHTG